MVSSMASYSEIGKAQEVANEVRRIYKQLLDAQNMSGLLNSRERLFGLPNTNVNYLLYQLEYSLYFILL